MTPRSSRDHPGLRQWTFAVAMLLLPMAGVLATVELVRYRAMGEAQREALALMDVAPPAKQGDNGFLWLATANHDVPEAELQAAMDQDRLAVQAHLDRIISEKQFGSDTSWAYDALQDSDYPARRPMALGSEACRLGAAGSQCLAAVMVNSAATRYLMDVEPARMNSARRALAAAHVTDTYGDLAAFVAFDPIALELTASALDAAEGRVPEAMRRTCGLLSWGRRHAAQAETINLKSQLWATWEASSLLLLDLRRAYPAVALPTPCRDALLPVALAEFDVCEVARKDYRRQRTDLSRPLLAGGMRGKTALNITAYFLSNVPLGHAWLAQRHAPYCGEGPRQALAAGAALSLPPDFEPAWWDCVAALWQCSSVRVKGLYRPTIAREWNQVTGTYARLMQLDAAHARAADALALGTGAR